MIEVWFTNDLHSHVPAAIGVLDAMARAREAGAIVVDGGDFYGGSAFHTFSGGRTEREIAAVCFDAMALGNHDLESVGEGELVGAVCANLRRSGRSAFARSRRLVRGRHSVVITAVIGYEAFAAITRPARVGLELVDVEQELDLLLPELRASADFVILLSHSGFAADLALAARYPYIDAILSAHCHSDCYLERVGEVVIAKAYEHGEGVGRLQLGEQRPARVELVRPPRQARFQHDLLRCHNPTLAMFERTHAQTVCEVGLPFVIACSTRAHQMERVASALLAISGSSLCVLNVHALRSEFGAGALSRKDLHDRLPFDDAVRMIPRSALPADWPARLAIPDEPVVQVESVTGDPTCCTTDYIASNLLGLEPLAAWPTIGTLRSFVAAHPELVFAGGPA